MLKQNVWVLVLAMMASGSLFAAEEKKTDGQSTIRIEDAADKKNKVDGNIDEEITNARMRATSGSKSKLSLSADIGYTGGAISRPFGQERPNLASEPGIEESTSGDVGLNARYRWSKNHSATLGTSFGVMTPFQGDMSGSENQLNFFDPSLGYSFVGKIGELQTSAGLSYSHGTSQASKKNGKDFSVGGSISALKAWQNGLTTGLSTAFSRTTFSDKPGRAPGFYGGDNRSQWNLGIYPFAEYTFNDTYSLRTVFGYFNWRHLYGDTDRYRLLQTFVYQSLGVGISVTRDIWLYPNVQFVPDNIRSDFTNVAISANINMF